MNDILKHLIHPTGGSLNSLFFYQHHQFWNLRFAFPSAKTIITIQKISTCPVGYVNTLEGGELRAHSLMHP
jgi:hypothetical protein